MKKLLLTLIVSLTLCGSIFAQHPETHWPGFVYTDYNMQGALYASIMINGEPVTNNTDNWDVMEVAAFVGDELRMTGMFLTDIYLEYGELFPTLNAEPIYYTAEGEEVSFKMYNHATGVEYGECHAIIWDDGTEITILTGEQHWEGFDDPDHPLMLNFIGEETTNYTRDIIPYTDPEGKDHYCLIATPVGTIPTSDVTNLTSNNYDLYTYNHAGTVIDNESDGLEWINHIGEEGFELVPGVGYLYANSGDGEHDVVTLDFGSDGVLEGPYEVELDYITDNPDFPNESWNLLGNPFCVDATIGDTKPFYRMINGVLEAQPEGTPIPAMEGFFVNAVEEGEQILIDVAPPQGNKAPMLVLNLSNGGKVVDRAIVSFGQVQQLPKFQLFKNSNVYIPMDGHDYALVRSEGMGEMPVSFKAESNGTYSLTLSSENVNFAYLHLIDNMTGADQDLLANPSYSFSANTTDYASRFRLVFATGNDEDNFAFFSNGTLVVSNEGSAILQVIDVTGRIVKCESISGCANVNIDAASGVYMVRLVNDDNVKVQKVVK